MKYLIRWLTAISCAALLGVGISSAQAPTVPATSAHNRLKAQHKRIRQGVRSGRLTPAETRRLERNAARINRSVRRDRVDGGVFTPHERARAQRKLNRQSRRIYREKHDNQTR